MSSRAITRPRKPPTIANAITGAEIVITMARDAAHLTCGVRAATMLHGRCSRRRLA